mgnify:CR=1 FL=1
MKKQALSVAVASALAFAALPASAQVSNDTIKIGFITDMSGVYADVDGPAGADAIKMAIADFGGNVNGKKIELVSPQFYEHNPADFTGVTLADTTFGGFVAEAVAVRQGQAFEYGIFPDDWWVARDALLSTAGKAPGADDLVVLQGYPSWAPTSMGDRKSVV